MQLKKIKVYGKLRQFLGKSYFKAAVKSPQQAMNFLFANQRPNIQNKNGTESCNRRIFIFIWSR